LKNNKEEEKTDRETEMESKVTHTTKSLFTICLGDKIFIP